MVIMSSTLILQITFPLPLYQNFDYLAPDGWTANDIKIGMRAQAPFGRRKLTGIVVGKCDHSFLPPDKLKSVTKIFDTQPVFDQSLLELLFWVAGYYQQPLGEVLSAALPAALRNGKYITPPTRAFYQNCTDKVSRHLLHRAPRQRSIIELLRLHPSGLDAKKIDTHLPNWRPAMNALIKKNLVRKVMRHELFPSTGTPTTPLILNEEQQHVYAHVRKRLNKFSSYLLAGVTGSGKTEVYLALIKDVIHNNRQALVLVPEIGLTPQFTQRIKTRLNTRIVVMHSNLSETENAQAWLAAYNGTAQIVVGTRSAVFLSFKNLGLIIVDEEHDLSFKQQEGVLYHARDIAVYRAKRASIPIILGSATPSFESQHNVNIKRYKKLVLSRRARQEKMPQIQLVDMRVRTAFGGLSVDLLEAIESTLRKNHQSLLFLNRRGYAPVLLCRDCGWAAECSRCDARMTFYKKQKIIRCHYCLKQERVPVMCPQCLGKNLLQLGEGTQRIEARLKKLFPNAAITRIDRDNTRKKHALQTRLNDIRHGKYQIIVGTQMLAKGHDFPKVTLVGILNVDQGLFSTDFRATERLAQLIVQVAGRAGRDRDKGRVLLQTHQPEHPLLTRLLADGYEAFSHDALKIRKSCALPPYTSMILIRARAHEQNLTLWFLQEIKNLLSQKPLSQLKILGPIPALLARKAGMYQNQLVIISSSREALQKQADGWTRMIQQSSFAKRVRWSIEVDPLEMG